MAELVNMPFDM